MNDADRDPPPPGQPAQAPDPDRLLEVRWRQGRPPDVRQFLADFGDLDPAQMLAVLLTDQRERWRAGERPPAEDYLRDHPAVRADAEMAVELIYGEFLAREKRGEAPPPEEFLKRFPEHADRLRVQIELHQALGSASAWPEADVTRTGGVPAPADSAEAAGPIESLLNQGILAPPTVPGSVARLDRFEIVRPLGAGGMGVVLLAHDPEAGRPVALKLLRPHLREEGDAPRRFLKEARHMSRLRHPNILTVTEVGERPEGPYYVMPFLKEGSLARRLRYGPPLDAATALGIARQVGEALAFAHRRGIIHRDLKPDNVLLNEGGRALLADFGLVLSLFNDSLLDVRHPQVAGTAPYMSPGVAAGEVEDTRCDIYAFGALLYEMLTGQPPYRDTGERSVLDQILSGPPRPIREANPKANPGLTKIAEGAMARTLRDRYADMGDVLTDIERVGRGEPPLGPHGLTPRWSVRGWRVIILAGLVAAGLLAAWGLLAHGW